MARDANAIPNNNAAAAEKEKKCSPDGFSYPDEDGTMRDIKVEDAEHAELLAKQFQEGNLEALKVVAECKFFFTYLSNFDGTVRDIGLMVG